jgi:hypothetical protein
MANQTITTNVNYDSASISGLANGETITLNSGSLTINSDVRWGQNAAVLGSITMGGTAPTTFLVDGRDVWWIPFDASTGNVPSLGTVSVNDVTGSIAGAGEFLGVFTALGVAPSTAGSAMPSTGYIKLRKKTANFVDNEVITFTGGATATVNSSTGGKRGWIHVVGKEGVNLNVPRLGTCTFVGDYFELGTTNGSDDQTFQFPVTDACPAIQVETAVGSGVYEWWLNSGDRWGTATQYVSTDERGKYFGMVNSTGVITIARRASNSCGYKPVSGLKVRIPNIILSSTTATDYSVNTINISPLTRYTFVTILGGYCDIQHVSSNWYIALRTAFYLNVANVSALDAISIISPSTYSYMSNVAVGINGNIEAVPLTLTTIYSGLSITDMRVTKYSSSVASSPTSIFISAVVNMIMTRVQSEMFAAAGSVDRLRTNTMTYQASGSTGLTFTDCTGIGGYWAIAGCKDVTLTNSKYADCMVGTTTTTIPLFAIDMATGCNNVTVEGFSSFKNIANVHPKQGAVNASGSFNITVKNIGSPSAPYNCGTVNPSLEIFNISACKTVVGRRLYSINTASYVVGMTNTSDGVLLENCWGDYADSFNIAATNSLVKGCKFTPSVSAVSSIYGKHWQDSFISTTEGRLVLSFHEPTVSTNDQAAITSGAPRFNSTNQIVMATLGDQAIFTMPYYCLGNTSFQNIAPIITGTLTSNMTYEYQIDTGSGLYNGVWKTLSAANLSAEVFTPTVGFKLKVRITTTTANASNVLTHLHILTGTDSTNQQIQYALPNDAAISIANITSGSRLQIYNVTTSTEIYNGVISGTTYSYAYLSSGGVISLGDSIRIRLAYISKLPYEAFGVATAIGVDDYATQLDDTIYISNAINGSAVTELAADYPNVQIDSNDADGVTDVKRIYAWSCYNQTTSSGIANMFGAIVAEDTVNYKIKTALVNLKFDNIISTPLLVTGGRIFRDDGSTVIATTSNSIQLDPDKAYIVTSGGSGATASDIWSYSARTLTSASSPSASSIATAVRTELTTELARIDVATSTRNAVEPDNTSITAIKTKTDNLPADPASNTQLLTRLAAADYIAPSNSEIAAIKAMTDNLPTDPSSTTDVLTRLAAGDYVAPNNDEILAIKDRTDNLPVDPASETNVNLRLLSTDYVLPNNAAIADIKTKTDNLPFDPASSAEVLTRLASDDYTAPNNAAILAVKAKTDNLPSSPASTGDVNTRLAAADYIVSPTVEEIRTELDTNSTKLDVAVSTRNSIAPDNSSIATILTQVNKFTFTGTNVNAISQVVVDKTGYTLTTGDKDAIAAAVETAVLNELDGKAVINAIVTAIGNSNVNETALVLAIRTDIERAAGLLAKVKSNADLIPAIV